MVGFTYMVHVYLAWCLVPGKEGILTGIVNAGFGLGGFIFTSLSISLTNPNSIPINKKAAKPFPPSIADNVPKTLQSLLCIWIGIFIFTLITMQDLPHDPLELQILELTKKIEDLQENIRQI